MITQGKYEIIHTAVERDNNLLSISSLCKLAGVSRSGYYAWEDAADVREKREEADRQDFEEPRLRQRREGHLHAVAAYRLPDEFEEDPAADEEIRAEMPI